MNAALTRSMHSKKQKRSLYEFLFSFFNFQGILAVHSIQKKVLAGTNNLHFAHPVIAYNFCGKLSHSPFHLFSFLNSDG